MTDPIKAKIHALCPDVLELKFGCEVRRFQNTAPEVFVMFDTASATGKRVLIWRDAEHASFWDEADNLTVLGSPITLAVVLRAIAAEPSKYTCWIDAECFDTPHFLLQKKRARYKDEQPILVWNLEQDNYDAQSQETKDFIGSLLGV